jgi:dihydroxyacetone kinase-like protein
MPQKMASAHVLRAMEQICDTIEAQKAYLSELDGAIGDGDHGVNMAKCFRQVKRTLADKAGKPADDILKSVGMVVLNSVGGAMGALYGTFFLKLSQAAVGKEALSLSDLVEMFQTAEQGVLDIGKAKPGDKTLVDTLSPAVRALEAARDRGDGLAQALDAFEKAAREGMRSTSQMTARVGRASRLGERTIGHQDAGATSCYFLLKAFADCVAEGKHGV